MTKLLEEAFAEAVKLPKKEQDRLAKWLLAELESERRWDEAFAGSTDQLAHLAHEALKEHRKGRTKPLNPEQTNNRSEAKNGLTALPISRPRRAFLASRGA